MSTADRIAALRAEGEAAVAAASATAELEDVRVRFLGRKAELPNLLRDVGKLPPEERGPVGKGANQARQALQAAVDSRAAELEALELESKLAADVVDVTLPGTPALPAGHLHILREARRQGDVLIVGLNSDQSIRKNKGPGRPFVSQDDRAAMLLALRDVDFVHVFDEPTPNAFLAEIAPDVHVNGAEYGENCIEAETVRAGGGRIHLVQRIAGLSTTDLSGRIADHVLQTTPARTPPG